MEGARLRLREIVHLIDREARPVLFSDFEDEFGAPTPVALNAKADFAAFKRKARAFLETHEDHVALRKLRTGRPLTATDISEFERMLVEAGVGSVDDVDAARNTEAAQVRGFGVFLRSLVGLDRAAAQAHFADFISDGASADQIEFVGMVIEHVTKNGVMDPGLLYDSPFSDRSPDGPDGLFDDASVERFVGRVRSINRSAVAASTAEAG